MSKLLSDARNDAIRSLARREYGVWELHKKLVLKGHDEDTVLEALEQLQADGMLSDERYAEARANSLKGRGYGPRHIQMELNEKRVPDRIIEAVLDQSAELWVSLAENVRVKKFGDARPKDFKDKAKQMRFLQYRGFSAEQIAQAVNNEND